VNIGYRGEYCIDSFEVCFSGFFYRKNMLYYAFQFKHHNVFDLSVDQ